MQFKSVFVLALAGSAFAQTLNVIKTELGKVGTALDGLDSALKGLVEGGDATALTKSTIAKASAVDKAIKSATSAIQGAPEKLSVVDAVQVSNAANGLVTKTDAAISSLIAKKSIIVKYNQGAEAKNQLTAQKTGADALANAIVDKMPSAAQGVAKSQAAKVGTAINKGLQAFS